MFVCTRVCEQNGTNNVAHKITNKLKLIIFFSIHSLLYVFFSSLILLFTVNFFPLFVAKLFKTETNALDERVKIYICKNPYRTHYHEHNFSCEKFRASFPQLWGWKSHHIHSIMIPNGYIRIHPKAEYRTDCIWNKTKNYCHTLTNCNYNIVQYCKLYLYVQCASLTFIQTTRLNRLYYASIHPYEMEWIMLRAILRAQFSFVYIQGNKRKSLVLFMATPISYERTWHFDRILFSHHYFAYVEYFVAKPCSRSKCQLLSDLSIYFEKQNPHSWQYCRSNTIYGFFFNLLMELVNF